jgi:hypothetical protein
VQSRSYLRRLLVLLILCALPGTGASPAQAQSASPNTPETAPTSQVATTSSSQPTNAAEIAIPGPLRSFLRMAAISQKVSPGQVLPFLARNVYVNGYWRGEPTEYLNILRSYIKQARELAKLAGPDGVIRVPTCAESQPLLAVLGYELKPGCGANASLGSADSSKAFLTVDSGFPLADLEEALRSGKPFVYPFSAKVPVIFTPGDWTAGQEPGSDLLDSLVSDPAMGRLYWALSRMDGETRNALRVSPGLPLLGSLAPVLDFYGGHISIRSGRVVVPGGTAAEAAWQSLVGASPSTPGQFVPELLAKDKGWLAAYFDALSRVNQKQQAYFADPKRLDRFYTALRGDNTSPSPAQGVFRLDTNLVLLVTRLQLDANGQPAVPGNLDAWKEIIGHGPSDNSKIATDWRKLSGHWTDADQLVEGMFGLSREVVLNGPVELYLTLCEIDRGRPAGQRLSPQTVRLLGEKYPDYGDQYAFFSEFKSLDNAAITEFLTVAANTDRMKDRTLRAETLGTLQADMGLWQILARQGQIPSAGLSDSWQRVMAPFTKIQTSGQLFDAGRKSLGETLRAAGGKADFSEGEILALLAGPQQDTAEGQQVRQTLMTRMRSVMDDQRLVSLDTLFALSDGLSGKTPPDSQATQTLIQQAGELRAFEMPRPLFTTRERAAWASKFFYNRHAESERQTDLTKAIQSRSGADVAKAHDQLAPFLRDTLVGLNYAFYEPPGAQLLHNNPLFVRFHDFSGESTGLLKQSWQTPILMGRGDTPSGGAHLAGSLANLPYVLASVEQGMFVPENVQSLIWVDLVPDLVASAVLPRWWGLSHEELHAVTLYQRTGEELLAAAKDEKFRPTVMSILSDRMLPERLEQVEEALRNGRAPEALALTTPAETFYLAAEFRQNFPGDAGHWGPAGNELQELTARLPEETSWKRLSDDFGVPHPVLAQSYGRELLDGDTFPSFMSYASRLLAESWDSSNLYWARLADEMGYQPVMLNLLVPELTRQMIGKISATHPDDWEAVQRAMQETGDEFRSGKLATLPKPGAEAGVY